MGSPNSSYVWIQFMAHLVSLGQLDAARAVAERALATINFRYAAPRTHHDKRFSGPVCFVEAHILGHLINMLILSTGVGADTLGGKVI